MTEEQLKIVLLKNFIKLGIDKVEKIIISRENIKRELELNPMIRVVIKNKDTTRFSLAIVIMRQMDEDVMISTFVTAMGGDVICGHETKIQCWSQPIHENCLQDFIDAKMALEYFLTSEIVDMNISVI